MKLTDINPIKPADPALISQLPKKIWVRKNLDDIRGAGFALSPLLTNSSEVWYTRGDVMGWADVLHYPVAVFHKSESMERNLIYLTPIALHEAVKEYGVELTKRIEMNSLAIIKQTVTEKLNMLPNNPPITSLIDGMKQGEVELDKVGDHYAAGLSHIEKINMMDKKIACLKPSVDEALLFLIKHA